MTTQNRFDPSFSHLFSASIQFNCCSLLLFSFSVAKVKKNSSFVAYQKNIEARVMCLDV